MQSFRTEDHVLRLMENQCRLERHLGRSGRPWEMCVDPSRGMALFEDRETGRPLLHAEVFLLGSYDETDGTFLWGWADPARVDSTTRFGYLRKDAEALGLLRFHYSFPFRVSDDVEAEELILIAAGYLGCFTYWRQPGRNGCRFLAIARCAAAEAFPSDSALRYAAIDRAIHRFRFDHAAGAAACFGAPLRVMENTRLYVVNDEPLTLMFDRFGRIIHLPRPAPVPAAPTGNGRASEDSSGSFSASASPVPARPFPFRFRWPGNR
ncbi:MAG: hypothetical protein SFU56_19885 [Capsulimonadales bacterium]|nr:hypothetical protein [Capsulimonadales bacterium]